MHEALFRLPGRKHRQRSFPCEVLVLAEGPGTHNIHFKKELYFFTMIEDKCYETRVHTQSFGRPKVRGGVLYGFIKEGSLKR